MKIMTNDIRSFLLRARGLALKSSGQIAVQAFIISFHKLIVSMEDESSAIHQTVGNALQLAFDDSNYARLLQSQSLSNDLQQLLKTKLLNTKNLSAISDKMVSFNSANTMNDDLLRFIVTLYVYVLIAMQLSLDQLNYTNVRLVKQLIDLVSDYIERDFKYLGRNRDLANTNFF